MQTIRRGAWPGSARALLGWTIEGRDGAIGRVEDAYFDDRDWTIRHLVVETAHRLGGRRVLLGPAAIGSVDPVRGVLQADLTCGQASLSPGIDAARPVSRQHGMELQHCYGFPSYAVSVAAVVLHPSIPGGGGLARPNAHLRSARAILGYYVHASDGDVGRAADFLISSGSWEIGQLAVAVGGWWPARRVAVPVGWIAAVIWGARAVEVSLSAEAIRLGPGYLPGAEISREHEERLARYYGPAPFGRERVRPPREEETDHDEHDRAASGESWRCQAGDRSISVGRGPGRWGRGTATPPRPATLR